MAAYSYFHKFPSIALCACLFLAILRFTNGDGVNDLKSISNLNISAHLSQNLLLKAAIPAYLQEFTDLFQDDKTSSELLQSDWFDGVSWSCKLQMVDWLTRLKPEHWGDLTKDKTKWVLQMIDAWGKIPEGIMSGHLGAHGDFDQCVQTEADIPQMVIPDGVGSYKFSGMYCTSYIVNYEVAMSITPKPVQADNTDMAKSVNSSEHMIQKAVSLEDLLKLMANGAGTFLQMLPQLGTCFPNVCTQMDVQQIMVNGMNNIYAQLKVEDPKALFWPLTVSCTDRHKPDFDSSVIGVIVMLAVLVGLALVTGAVDYWQQYYKPESTITQNTAYRYLMAFSAYTNTKKLVSTRRGPEDLSCLHGIRFLSTAWVVLGHSYVQFVQAPQWNMVDLNDVYKDWSVMAIINGTFSVDTFFLMSGMLATYNILKTLDKTKGRLNVIMLYIHRYIRLTPTYAILIEIVATLVTYAGNGPNWWTMSQGEISCRKYWWTNILYVNNIVTKNGMCNGESWYLANDMQFFILSPLIVYPIWRWELMGTLLLCIYTILSCIAPVLVTRYATDAIPAPALTRREALGTGFPEIYYRPWSRINTFLVGVWLGWILHKTRGQQVKLPKLAVVALWLTSTGTALAVVFGIAPWFDPQVEIPRVAGYFYAGLGRFSFVVAVSWVIFACLKGYGGIVNEFLSWKAFMPLGRLCFCVYLVSFHLQGMFHARLTVPIKWDTYTVVNLYFAHMVMSYLVGFLCTLLFESPFIILQKLLFEDKKPVVKKVVMQSEKDYVSNVAKEEQNNNAGLTNIKKSSEL